VGEAVGLLRHLARRVYEREVFKSHVLYSAGRGADVARLGGLHEDEADVMLPVFHDGIIIGLKGNPEGELSMDGTRRTDIRPGQRVSIMLKKDQHTGKLTEGIVKDILTDSPTHPHGIKVRLESGEVGRVKEIGD
jgi:uncharacterized repeat protein (TIGR03833 family)